MSPMRGDVKEKIFLRPLREEMDVAIGIQPNLRSGEAAQKHQTIHDSARLSRRRNWHPETCTSATVCCCQTATAGHFPKLALTDPHKSNCADLEESINIKDLRQFATIELAA